MDTRLEVVVIPVSDVDRAKAFCSMPTRFVSAIRVYAVPAMQAGLDGVVQQDPEAHCRGSSRLFRFLDGNLAAPRCTGRLVLAASRNES